MGWLVDNWHLAAVLGGVALIIVGVLDVETTARLGVEWDRQQIAFGAGVLIAGAPPTAGRIAGALRGG